jgi:hypothetical protein
VKPTGSEDGWIAFIYSNLDGGTFSKPVLEDWLKRHVSPSR